MSDWILFAKSVWQLLDGRWRLNNTLVAAIPTVATVPTIAAIAVAVIVAIAAIAAISTLFFVNLVAHNQTRPQGAAKMVDADRVMTGTG